MIVLLFLRTNYNVLIKLLNKFGFIIKYLKTEIFYFNRSYKFFNSFSLDFSTIEGSTLCFKNSWKYLRFIFDKKLTFYQHINYYSNKAILIIKCININIIYSITLYSYQLWFYNKAFLLYHMKILGKIQRKTVI